ncbi:MAG: diguanylate cyclase [Betaproteobacteria bacterium]|nr:diguanylate cyclase [Betaproteobacteria bacterium]
METAASTAVPAAQDKHSDDARRVAVLLRLMPRSMALNATVSVITALMLSPDLPAGVLGMWLGVALLVTAARYSLYLLHRKAPQRFRPAQWDAAAAAGAFAMGCTWASLTLLGPLPASKTLFIALVLCFAAQSSTGILSASARAFAAFVIPVVVALLALLFREFGGLTWPGALVALLFAFVLVTTFLDLRRAQANSLHEARVQAESFRQQRLIFEAVQTGIALTRDRVITDFNPRAAAMFGYTREELIGKSSRVLFFDDATWEQAGQQAFATLFAGKTFRAEVTLRAKDGTPVTCELSMDALTPGRPDTGIVIMMNDVTERRRLEVSLKDALAQQQAVFDNAPVGIAFTRERKLALCNERMLAMFGYTLEEIQGRDGSWLYADQASWKARGVEIAQAFARGEQVSFQEAFVTKQGQPIWCQVRGSQIESSSGTWGTAVFTFADVGERKRMEESLRESREQLDLVIRASMAGTWDWDIAADVTTISPRFAEILGFAPDTPAAEIVPLAARIHPEDREQALRDFARHLKSREPVRSVLRLRARDGSYRWVNADGISQHGPDGRAVRSIGAISDITALKEREAEIARLALEDPLTGLPNRRLFEDRLDHALTSARRNRGWVAVMLIDLDGFKSINDQHGHEAGDAVLIGVATRLRTTVREADTIARTGGDEFIVIAESAGSKAAIQALAEKVRIAIGEPLSWCGKTLRVGASIGVALYPDDADHPAQLVRMADEAMYRVKEAGRDGVRFHGDAEQSHIKP